MMYQKYIYRLLIFVLALLPLYLSAGTAFAQATTEEDAKAIYGNWPLYQFSDQCAPSQPGSGASTTSATGNAYVLGDSISTGLKNDGLEQKLRNQLKGDARINNDDGRSITKGGLQQRTSALTAVDQDKEYIKTAGVVVVVLGTNQTDDPFDQNMTNLMQKLKAYAPNTKYYWVDIGATRPDQVAGWNKRNQIIYGSAATLGYTVISRYKAIFNANVDPLNIQPGQQIPDSPDNIHGAYPQLSQAILFSLGAAGASSGTTTTAQGCVCSATGTTTTALAGKDNAEKIYNYFVTKGKLQPHQAAGIMGNMQSESGLDPRALQPGTTGDAPIRGRGYGLVQWTFEERQKPLEDRAKAAGVPVYDLGLQLDYVMYELDEKMPDIGKQLRATTDVKSATLLIETKYEIHKGGIQPERQSQAETFLAQFGSNAGTAGASGGTSCTTNSAGQVVGSFSLPVDIRWYNEHKEWFTKPHHDYPAADIPVPSGTEVFALAAGTITSAPTSGGCGIGIVTDIGNNIEVTYCHGQDGGSVPGARQGDKIIPGQLIMHSDNTGSSTGPHLHVQIKVNGTTVCPQTLLEGIANGKPVDIATLPSSGCTN